MNIGIVTPVYPPTTTGGGAFSTKLLVEKLRNRGHEVEVLSFDSKPEEDYDYVERVPHDSNRFDVRNFKARGEVKEFSKDKDVIHSYNMTFHPAVASIKDVKTVATLNNYKFFYPYSVSGVENKPRSKAYRTLHDTICRILMRRMDNFTALSTDVKKEYSRILSEDKITVVPNMYNPDFPEFQGLETNPNELLYVGSIGERKGVEQLVRAMKDVEDKTLRVVGDGEQKEELEELTKELGIEDRVIFEGYVDHNDLPRYYERAGWFIHPGKWPEPFGRTILEAMQMKAAVIATNRGGPKDVLPEDQLVEDVSEIKDKLENLDREKVIKEQDNRLEKYSPEKVVSEFLKVYKK
jgi:glycosyltransferase involved in cell wall biosynthesis